MTDELKPCPFCGSKDNHGNEDIYDPFDNACFMSTPGTNIRKLWNTRPIEDDLRKQLIEWKAAHDNLAQQLSTTNDLLEIAVDVIDLLRGLAVIEVDEDINDWNKIQDMLKKLGINE
jgi:hypothetical protein